MVRVRHNHSDDPDRHSPQKQYIAIFDNNLKNNVKNLFDF